MVNPFTIYPCTVLGVESMWHLTQYVDMALFQYVKIFFFYFWVVNAGKRVNSGNLQTMKWKPGTAIWFIDKWNNVTGEMYSYLFLLIILL